MARPSANAQQDEHFVLVCRYIERNPLRAKLVRRAEDWPWSSLAVWRLSAEQREAPQREAEQRGRPFGSALRAKQTAQRLGLKSTFRPRGRPRRERE